MALKLIKAASEFNISLGRAHEFLIEHGFEIDKKPTAKIDDEMYRKLSEEFSGDKAKKELADEISLNRIKKEEVEINSKATTTKAAPVSADEVLIKSNITAPVAEPEEIKEEVKEEVEPQPEPVVEEPKIEEVKEAEVIEAKAPELEGPKVIGKLDLEEKETKSKEEKPKTKKPKKEKKETKKEAEEKQPVVAKTKKVAEPEEVIFRETQKITLEGPKVLGKIEIKEPEKKDKSKAKPKTAADANKKRKRKRFVKAKTSDFSNKGDNKRGGRRGKREDKPAISQKEIQDKLKATMAKVSGIAKGKSQRSKLRKAKRDNIAAASEEAQLQAEIEQKVLQVSEFVSVSELASLMDVSVTEVISKCMGLGVIVSINQRIDAEVIELVAGEFDFEVNFMSVEQKEDVEVEEEDDPADLKPRSPIVTIMGHVDHGKTSLLDYIREANVIAGEVGGITQHIGAYEVTTGNGDKITFLDTPGHEAFTAMRARGAKVTDISIIVIAADDAVMPQTKEAISHSQAAGVPMIFAINKIDKPTANADRIKEQLSQMNILVEDWGGQFQCQEISAKTGLNVDDLLEKVLLETEMLELKANPDRNATGTVLEASLDKGKGYVSNILVQNGTLKVGDFVVAGSNVGRVKAMYDERSKKMKDAGPSTPLLLLGLDGAPQAGERFKVYENESEAKNIANSRIQLLREQGIRTQKRISLDELGRRLALGNFKELNLIIKGDVDGSIEATSDALLKLSTDEIQVNVIQKSVGQISETDVMLASASDAIIIGFQVRPSPQARRLAENEGVEIRLYSIIYKAVEEIEAAMEGMLEPTVEERITCNIDVREVFKISKVGTIAGCLVTEGKVNRNTKVRLIRDGIVVYPTKANVVGEITSLKRFKDDAKEVVSGMECGIGIKNFNDIKVGDVIEGYEQVEVKRTLNKK